MHDVTRGELVLLQEQGTLARTLLLAAFIARVDPKQNLLNNVVFDILLEIRCVLLGKLFYLVQYLRVNPCKAVHGRAKVLVPQCE